MAVHVYYNYITVTDVGQVDVRSNGRINIPIHNYIVSINSRTMAKVAVVYWLSPVTEKNEGIGNWPIQGARKVGG